MRNQIRAAALLGGLLMSALSAPALAAVAVVTVAGTADPHLAGQPIGTTLGGDSAPANSPVVALTGFAAGSSLSFSGVGGFRNVPDTPVGLDGGPILFNQIDALGIAGLRNAPLNGLVGVFLGADVPVGPAPAFRDDGTSFSTLSPLLRQVFWIGDGLTGTGSGAVQQFIAPTGATRLFLTPFDGSGGYFDNVGTATITISYTPSAIPDPTAGVPEPATWGMMILGFGLAGGVMRRRRTALAA